MAAEIRRESFWVVAGDTWIGDNMRTIEQAQEILLRKGIPIVCYVVYTNADVPSFASHQVIVYPVAEERVKNENCNRMESVSK